MKITLVGVGLIGGSIALKLKRKARKARMRDLLVSRMVLMLNKK